MRWETPRSMRAAPLVVIPLVLAAAIACPDSAAIVRRYRRLLGATAGATVRLEGRRGNVAWRGLRSPAGYRYAVSRGDIESAWGADGATAWQREWNGFVGYAGAHRRQLERTVERVVSGAIAADASDDGGCLRIHRRVTALRWFYPKDGAPVEIAFDARTAQVAFARIEPSGANLRLGGISYLTSRAGRLIGSWALATTGFHADRAEIVPAGAAIDDVPPPAPRSPLGAPFSLPVAKARGGHALTVTASVNGVPGRFLVDSGATDLTITPAYAKRAGVRSRWSSGMLGITGFRSSFAARAETLTVGPLTLRRELLLIQDQQPGFDGLLGLPLFALGAVTLDANASTLTVSPSAQRAAPGTQPLLDTYDGTPVAAGTAGRTRFDFVLDTGSAVDFLLPIVPGIPPLAKSAPTCPNTGFPGMQGRLDFDPVAFGDTPFGRQPACVFAMNLLGRSDLGLVGFDALLRGGSFSLDYRAGTYAIGSGAGTAPAAANVRRFRKEGPVL